MNYRMIWQILGRVLLIEAALLVLPLITGIWYGENLLPFIITMAASAAAGGILISIKLITR